MEVARTRDITLIDRGDYYLIIGCDSCGGVGNKPLDLVKVSPETTGYYTTRVAMMEVMSVGAVPFSVVNTLAVEMEPTGKAILTGIRQLLQESGLPLNIINGSTEENFMMQQTAMGVTIIGEVPKQQLRLKRAQKGDYIMLLGLPRVGGEILLPHDPVIASLKNFTSLLQSHQIGDIIPVGSKGVLYEACLLADLNHCQLQVNNPEAIDLNKSAGPATAVVFSVSPGALEGVRQTLDQPLYQIGSLI